MEKKKNKLSDKEEENNSIKIKKKIEKSKPK